MVNVGIICEYNPFHNGHVYHIKKIKEMFPESTIICVMSSNYVERGEVSMINKWDKTKIALDYGVDLVIELPFAFASQSADIFCRGAISLLTALKVDYCVFGSETSDIELLTKLAKIQESSEYNHLVKNYLDQGNNYPMSMAKALKHLHQCENLGPNDTLGLGYIREIRKQKSNITPITIKRTNDYHALEIESNIASATAIRNLIKEQKDVDSFIPYSIDSLSLHFNEDYFPLLKYKIISDDNLSRYQTVDEGIENRMKKYIIESKNLDEFIHKIKTKRYTYHKISRMLIHILTSFTKEEANRMRKIEYIRVLGFNQTGKKYIKNIKKETTIPIISKFEPYPMLILEQRVSLIYDHSLEYKMKPIIKK